MKSPRRTPAQWQALINEQQASGLSAPKFCEQSNIVYASFSKWRKQLATPKTEQESPAFIELVTPPQPKPEPQSWAVELAISDAIILRIAKT